MKCKYIQKKLSAYLDNEVNDELKEQIYDHVNNCSECSARLAYLQQSWDWLGEEPAIQFNPFFATRVKQKIQEIESRQSSPFIWVKVYKRFLLPATVLVGLILGVFLGSQLRSNLFTPNTASDTTLEIINTSTDALSDFPTGSFSETYNELDLIQNGL